ncbi:hypothetical protein OEA41_005587 [Lepraria neglecta]|uniref:NmrA-like domain-containing protein n=1 Tax=Lepraria neglecta TaxID=209136 RepID=A0AAD9Z9N2_9LECA|nr:hypothetical protein OEA41_005587 [Lepraria neglecta]
MASPKALLVLGAAGKQGKTLVDTIVASDSKSSFTILVLTHNPDSPSAKALAAKSSTIKLVKGNLDDVPACFKAALEATNGTPIWGVFSVQQAVQDAFMDGLTPNFMGKMFTNMLKASLGPKPLSFTATSDIGFLQPESQDYKNQAISLAGDNLTFEEISQVFQDKLGYPAPTTFEFLAHFVKWMLSEIGTMLRWFSEEGFVADIAKLKRMNPGLMSLGDWLEKESGFSVKN